MRRYRRILQRRSETPAMTAARHKHDKAQNWLTILNCGFGEHLKHAFLESSDEYNNLMDLMEAHLRPAVIECEAANLDLLQSFRRKNPTKAKPREKK